MARFPRLSRAVILASSVALASQGSFVRAETKPTAPATPVAQAPNWPKVIAPAAAAVASDTSWSKDEIDAAKAKCAALLKGLDAVAIPSDPMRSGQCGAPAPVELISVGSKPQVTFSTPVVMTCDMVKALHDWLKKDVQPAARGVLGAPVVRLDVMSGYSCRNAYGRKHNRMSEHGRANAIDLKAFITEKGETIDFLNEWGLTEREAKARIAAAEKAQRLHAQQLAQAAQAAHAAAKAAPPPPPQIVAMPPQAPPPALTEVPLRGTLPDPLLSGTMSAFSRLIAANRDMPTAAFGPPAHLGGPKVSSYVAAADPKVPRQRFVRMAHATACHIFGTVLGPEANEAHRNHLHLDMADRPTGVFCE